MTFPDDDLKEVTATVLGIPGPTGTPKEIAEFVRRTVRNETPGLIHDQGTWMSGVWVPSREDDPINWCGTACCVAGAAVIAAGAVPHFSSDLWDAALANPGYSYQGTSLDECVDVHGTPWYIPYYAGVVLGLDGSDSQLAELKDTLFSEYTGRPEVLDLLDELIALDLPSMLAPQTVIG